MERPNILYVFADQLRYGAVGFNGNRIVRTPTLDGLAREGVVLDQAVSSCPICGPYRGQLLTGKYSHANGVIDNEYRLFPNQATMARIFGREGYRTAYIGKWHVGHPPFTKEAREGFDDLIGYNNGHSYYEIDYWRNEKGPQRMVDFAPYVETQLTLDYIDRHLKSKPEQPFCTVLSWGPPHWSFNENRDYDDYPKEFDLYTPDMVDVPDNVPIQFRDFAQKELAGYYAMTAALDSCMKRILESLERWGLRENTIVCFTSDHGDHLSAHGFGKPSDLWMHHTLRASKATPYDESVHVPFVLRYPAKVLGNRRSDTLFSSVDVLPTLLGLAGVPVPDDVQGSNLSHVFLGGEGPEPDSAYLQILGPGWPTRSKWVGLWRGVRTTRYTYARWRDRDGLRMLFDRDRDPLEMTNFVEHPDYAVVAAELEGRLQEWLEATRDPFDTGARLPDTGMLDLGQRFTSRAWYGQAPRAYAEAIKRYQLDG